MKMYKYVLHYTTGQIEDIIGPKPMDLKQLRMNGTLYIGGDSPLLINLEHVRKIEEIVIEEGGEQ